MLGLFGNLSVASRALQAQAQSMEVAGQNLANVNNPAYARQRVTLQTSAPIPDATVGLQGSGADVAAIDQIRDSLLDDQIRVETSVRGSLDSQQRGLQYAQAGLGQDVNSGAAGASGSDATNGVSGTNGIATRLSDLFNAFQGLSTNPTSLAQRQVVIAKAQDFTTQLNQTATRLGNVRTTLNNSLQSDVTKANAALTAIAELNNQIISAEIGHGTANELRDLREQKLEDLAKLAKITVSTNAAGSLDIDIGGATLVSGATLNDTLEAYDPGGGGLLIRTKTGAAPITIGGGSLQGTIDIRDGALATLQSNLDTFASQIASQVNTAYSAGFGLDGSTGQNFFTGTTAATISVTPAVAASPNSLQAAGVAGAAGDNTVALAIAQLSTKKIAGLGNQTFSESYASAVGDLGQSLTSVNDQISSQNIVQKMLSTQRDSISGVSLDEEMTDMMRFQRAYQANARLISVIDQILQTAIGLGGG